MKKTKQFKQEIRAEQIPSDYDAEDPQLFNNDRITFKLPKSIKIEFLELAKRKCINISQVLRVAVNDFIEGNQ